jgi:hypothetical protein
LLDGLELDAGGSVVFVPHGILNYLPFEVLWPDAGVLLRRIARRRGGAVERERSLRLADNRPGPQRYCAW